MRRRRADQPRRGTARRKQAAAALLAANALTVFTVSACSARPHGTAQTSQPAAARSASTAVSHGTNPQLVACEQRSSACERAALKKFPLNRPVPAGTPLLTRRVVLAELGLTHASAVATRTTYRQIRAADPALAASSVIYPSRIVWVITRFFAKPVSVPQTMGPPSAPTSITITAASYVIDAATGTMTDSCQGCAALTRTGAIVKSP